MQKCVTALRSCSIREQLKSSMCTVIFPIGTQTQSFVYKLWLSVDCLKVNKYKHNLFFWENQNLKTCNRWSGKRYFSLVTFRVTSSTLVWNQQYIRSLACRNYYQCEIATKLERYSPWPHDLKFTKQLTIYHSGLATKRSHRYLR